MEDDMLKTQRKAVDIPCNLELIYPPAFFDIMIHMVIHLPLEALESRPIHPRWMFPFEKFMKKLKGYIRNKAKLEGSIAEGYVVEEALTFSSHYFRDVTMKFNRPDRNVDPLPQRICQRHIDKDPGVSVSSELFDLACGPTPTPISVNSCVVNDVRFIMHNHDECHTTQNSGICSPGGKDEEINEERKVNHLVLRNNMTQIWAKDMIIDVDEDDDIINDEGALPYDLVDSEDEDLVNIDDDDDVVVVYSNVARGHGGKGGGDDRLPPHQIPTGCGGCLVKGTRKSNLGGWKAGRLHTRQETQNLRLKKITDLHGLVPILFE
nr:hypothetical protein [Tanacetum cinerariifolium]